jgi:hypothetical protein
MIPILHRPNFSHRWQSGAGGIMFWAVFTWIIIAVMLNLGLFDN